MRRSTWISLAVLAALGVGVYLFLTDPFKNMAGAGRIDELTKMFMEDVQFKDFRRASKYHHELERDRMDIGRAIETIFVIKLEALDIQEFHIVKTMLSSENTRGRTLVRTKLKRLNAGTQPEEKDIILYWIKRHPQCPLGATCGPKSTCIDEFGEQRLMPKEDKKEKATTDSDQNDVTRGDALDPELSANPYTCDPLREHQWFMNLDSSLKSKRYK